MVIVYHVTTYKKLTKYVSNGYIKPPVRVWNSVQESERFSKQTGRKVILRLKINAKDFNLLDGHGGNALVSKKCLLIDSL